MLCARPGWAGQLREEAHLAFRFQSQVQDWVRQLLPWPPCLLGTAVPRSTQSP